MKKTLSAVLSLLLCAVLFISSCTAAFAEDLRYGVDVSHNNSVVNFTDLKNSGKTFAMIRLGYYNHLDTKFWDNVKAVCDADMDFGVYLYSYAESVEEAKIEAGFVLETLSQLGDYGKKFTLPVAYDMEDSKIAVYGKEQLTCQMTTFLDIIKSAGYTPMIYANSNWFNNYIDLNTAKQYKIWYANWNSGTPESTGRIQIGNSGVFADMWQYADGKSTGLDQNVLYDPADIIKPLSCCHAYEMSDIIPSCNQEGVQQWKCKNCGNSFTVSVPKSEHTVAVDHAVSATYFSKGKTQGSHCSVCGEVLVPQKSTANKKATIKKVTAKKKAISVKWSKISSAKGYEIQYSTSKSFTKKTTKTKTIKSAKTVSTTVSNLKAKKKYYVRIRAYKTSKGKKVYSSWSATKSIKTK